MNRCFRCVWRTILQDDGDGKENCLAESDKDTIKVNIVPLMCKAPPEVQRQARLSSQDPCSLLLQ